MTVGVMKDDLDRAGGGLVTEVVEPPSCHDGMDGLGSGAAMPEVMPPGEGSDGGV